MPLTSVGYIVICYCVIKRDSNDAESDAYFEVQDQHGRRIESQDGVLISEHPTVEGAWRLGPFYMADRSVKDYPDGLVD
jgi:hypothetical protein